jgi:hypothetical protein
MNPHCRMKGVPQTASDFLRTLDHCGDGVCRLTCQAKRPGERFSMVQNGRRKLLLASTVQNGQRKLLRAKIELLCKKDPLRSYNLVCVAPGSHLPLLAGMFPNVHFHLYDPRPISIDATPRIRVHRRIFPKTTPGLTPARAASTSCALRNVRRIVAADGVWPNRCGTA